MSWFWPKRSTPAPDLPRRLAPLAMSEEHVVGAALLSPGFAPDLSTWRLTITRAGLLRQVILVADYENSYRGELRQEASHLPSEELVAVMALAERIGFRNFRDRYEHETMMVTHLPTLLIAIRFADAIKAVEAYGPKEIAAHENNQDMAHFVELWARIHRYAPYPSAAEATGQLTRAYFAVPVKRPSA